MWPDWGISPQSAEQFRKVRSGALVSPDTLKRFNLHLGQQIQLRGTLYPFNVTLTLVGTINSAPVPYLLLFRRDYLEEAAGRPGTVDNFWVRVDSAHAVQQVIAALDEKFANSSAETQSESESAFLARIVSNYRMFFRLAELLGAIVVLTIGLVAANTAAMSIRERRSEIAVMRAIGFPPWIIFSLLLSESLLIGLARGIIGCGSGFIALKLFTVGAAAIGPLGTIRMPPSVLAETLVAAVLIGVLSALVPARSAAQRNIVDTLRMVD